MTAEGGLQPQAEALASELSLTMSAFLGREVQFHALSQASRVALTTGATERLTISVSGRQLLSVAVKYLCRFDHQKRYLAIHSSTVKVFGTQTPNGEPLFRYEFVYEGAEDLPAAHLQVHAHRDQFTHVMTLASEAGSRRRQRDRVDSVEAARLCNLHFPLGGHRFRPALEDVLQMVHVEFGTDVGEDWSARLSAARLQYRRQQTAAVVRDCPSEAVRVLSELGYTVGTPATGPLPDRESRLLAF